MTIPLNPPRRRNPVAKSLRRLGGGPHRTGPSRADLKRALRRRIDQGEDQEHRERGDPKACCAVTIAVAHRPPSSCVQPASPIRPGVFP